MPPAAWSEAQLIKLRKLWDDGLTASEIAAEIGGFSRNAVIGKAHRLGLSRRATSRKPKPRSEEPKVQKPKKTPRPPQRMEPIESFFTEKVKPVEPHTGPIEYSNLRDHHCRAFTGDTGADGLPLSCGKNIEIGRFYMFCSDHLARYTQAPEKPIKRR